MTNRYRGFSTINQSKKFRLTDLELVKRDLLNHFAVRKGEKLMQPNFGSIIWDMLFEPLTVETQDIIVNDIKRIVNYDPRISVSNVLVDAFDYGLQVQIELVYLPANYSDRLILKFDNQSRTLTQA